MKRYSFLEEALGNKLAGVGAGIMKNLSKNKMATNAMIGGAVGGTVNKIRGGSFWKGAGVGAAAGAGAGYIAKNSNHAQILRQSLADKAKGGSFKYSWKQGQSALSAMNKADAAHQAALLHQGRVAQRIQMKGLSARRGRSAAFATQQVNQTKQAADAAKQNFQNYFRR